MTVFSVITNCAVAVFFAQTAYGGRMIFDVYANGKHWFGLPWNILPSHVRTDDCVCIKGTRWDTKMTDAVCYNGITFGSGPRREEDLWKTIPFDGRYKIDITTHGNDGLWMDRVKIETDAGYKWYGSQNTHGWCLSKDHNEKFGGRGPFNSNVSHEGCYQTLSFRPNGYVHGYRAGSTFAFGGYGKWKAASSCKKDPSQGRRRIEGSEAAVPASVEAVVDRGDDPGAVLDDHRTALVHERLRSEIRRMVHDNSDVTDAQIDSILNSVMLDVEHQLEREEHDEDVLEPESLDVDGATGVGRSDNNRRNAQERLQSLLDSANQDLGLSEISSSSP